MAKYEKFTYNLKGGYLSNNHIQVEEHHDTVCSTCNQMSNVRIKIRVENFHGEHISTIGFALCHFCINNLMIKIREIPVSNIDGIPFEMKPGR